MNYLSDTHIFLWSVFSPGKISRKFRALLLDPKLTKYVSVVTFWEISLKFSLGKIDLKGVAPDMLLQVAKETGFEILPLDAETATSFYKLPKIANKDPFDRMLAWQSIVMDFTLLTSDKDFIAFKAHGLKMSW